MTLESLNIVLPLNALMVVFVLSGGLRKLIEKIRKNFSPRPVPVPVRVNGKNTR